MTYLLLSRWMLTSHVERGNVRLETFGREAENEHEIQ